MVIRRATAVDAAALTSLAHAAKAHWGYPAEWLELWRDDLTLGGEYLESNRAFVAEEDARIAGVAVLESRDEEWAIEHVWIHPQHQRKGVGRALVLHALDAARTIRPGRISVLSDPFAEEFYLRLGARRTGFVPAPMPGAPDRALPLLEW